MSSRQPPPPPTPRHHLRSHSSSITAVALSDDNERIYSADSSGRVVVTSSRSLRPITAWNPHTDSVLGVEEWDEYIITHGRDNKIHVWNRLEELPISHRIGGSAALQNTQNPSLCLSMDVNALNFCRFSLMKQSLESTSSSKPRALIALPNLVDSTTIDIWSLPSKDRIHAAIGQQTNKRTLSEDQMARNTSGIIMSLHLYKQTVSDPSSPSASSSALRILAAYENGSVVLRENRRRDKDLSVEGQGWDVIWKAKLHVETIMAMKVSRANKFALTVSADHIVGHYDLTKDIPADGHGVAYRTKHPGNGSLAIRDDGKVCAVGGWDGKIRLYSTKSFKSLGILKYHKLAAQCLEFARDIVISVEVNKSHSEVPNYDEEDMDTSDRLERSRWLVAGSKDCRVSIWSLISFAKCNSITQGAMDMN